MVLVFVLGGVIWGIGHLMRTPHKVRFRMLGVLYVGVLMLHIGLPDGHPIRLATGGSVAPWLILGGGGALIFMYREALRRIRAKAGTTATAHSPQNPAQSNARFSAEELERYARHITLPDIGGRGQRALKNAKVLVIGAGGLGAPALLYLAGAGVGRIGVIDPDVVDLSNLHRQVIHTDARQNMPKVFSAHEAMAALNPHIDIRPYHRALDKHIAADLFADYDLILDGTDTYATRALVNQASVATHRPVIAGAISAWEGQITLYDPAMGAPCMACVFPHAPAPEMAATCAETGVIGPLPGVVGTMMAVEAIKEIVQEGVGLRGKMLIYDALHAEVRAIIVNRRTDCPVCGNV